MRNMLTDLALSRAPIRSPSAEHPETRIDCPLLGVNSEAFMYWEDNFAKAMSVVKESAFHSASAPGSPSPSSPKPTTVDNPDPSHSSYLLTVKGTVHLSQSDFALLYPHIISFSLHSTVTPHKAIEVNIRASLEFLRRVLPERIAAVERASKSASLLDVKMLEELPTSGKPIHDKHLAVRVRRPSRALLVLRGKLNPYHIYRKAKHEQKLEVSADDIWMHFAPGGLEPDQEDIEANSADKEEVEQV